MKVILDPGHGGRAFGRYVTPGKRSPEVPPGIYEGVFNRLVAVHLSIYLGDDCTCTELGPINPPLKTRTDFANSLPYPSDEMLLISIHANAAPGKGWSRASGSRIFIARNASKRSSKFAGILGRKIDACEYIPYSRRPTKRAGFHVLTRTRCPAVLIECGFMTNREDVKFMTSYDGPVIWAQVLAEACEEYAKL